MLDTSGSMTASLELVKDGAEQFLMRLLPEDKAQVGAFNDKIEFHPGDSSSSDRDRAGLPAEDELDFGYPTRLYDAVDESIERLQSRRRPQRRARLHRRRRHGEQDWRREGDGSRARRRT